MDDLLYKVSYYLTHEDERLEIAQNGYNKVKNLHQFKSRILEMLKLVFDTNKNFNF